MSKARMPPFASAISAIDKFERAVVYRMVTIDFTADDVLEMVVAAHVLDKLRAAHPYVQGIRPSFDLRLAFDATIAHVNMDPGIVKCLTPHDLTVTSVDALYNTPKRDTILTAMRDTIGIVNEHNVLRRIVEWFNEENVTPSFARYYCPALGSLLPAGHAFHEKDGRRFRDQPIPHHIVQDIRRASEIITKGLFCNPNEICEPTGTAYGQFRVPASDAQWFTWFAK